jgi:hypothetical protein
MRFARSRENKHFYLLLFASNFLLPTEAKLVQHIFALFHFQKFFVFLSETILQEAAQIINSRSLASGSWAESRLLCPEDLMVDKAGAGVPVVHFKTG